MISLNNFYYVLYTLLFKPIKVDPWIFYPFGTSSSENIHSDPFNPNRQAWKFTHAHFALMHNEEPIFDHNWHKFQTDWSWWFCNTSQRRFKFLANSEISRLKKEICKEFYFLDFYFFFHGFLALSWYNDIKYFKKTYNFKNSYICLNNLCSGDRSYRLHLISKLKQRNLLACGSVSLNLENSKLIQNELTDSNSKLSKNAKKEIFTNLGFDQPSLILDTEVFSGKLSGDFDFTTVQLWQDSFFHIVTETVFYYDKLHLTEKIFKPIVSKRPFILVASAGNLNYLKSYGFKTFDRWIDESYDLEQDNDTRIEKIVENIEYICSLSQTQQQNLMQEMQEILDYNYNHFYGNFKNIIVNELVDNFEGCLRLWNNGRIDDQSIDLGKFDFQTIKQILAQ